MGWRGSLEKSIPLSVTALFCSVLDEEKGTRGNGNILSVLGISVRCLNVFEANINNKNIAYKQLCCNSERSNGRYFKWWIYCMIYSLFLKNIP